MSSSDAGPGPEVRQDDLRSSTQLLILTVYGRYSAVVGGWMAVAHLIELLPDGWRGAEADHLFRELRALLEPAASEFVASVVHP